MVTETATVAKSTWKVGEIAMTARQITTRLLQAGVALAVLGAMTPGQAQERKIRIHYAIPTIWEETQEKLEEAYEARNPNVDVVFDGPAEGYGAGIQRLLRENVANNLPDAAFVGLNRWRVLEDRGISQPLDSFIGDMAEFKEQGYTEALLSLGRYEGQQHALATSASTLVMYMNPDLLARAGYDRSWCPGTYDAAIQAASDMHQLGDNIDGIWIDRHDWRFQSLLGAYGGRPMTPDETDITFDKQPGIEAARLYARFAKEAGMPGYIDDQARQAYPAGTLGIMMDSSSLLTRFKEGAGENFDVRVCPLPTAAPDNEVYFPTGGSGIVMLAEDPEQQKLVWDYMRFVTGPEGARIVVENTGYAPTNSLVLEDDDYLGEFYSNNPNARIAHAQVANYAGPWYAYPGDEGVAVTDLISEALWDITDGANPETRIKTLAETVRSRLNMQ
jgi:multiple sugar transport system substrate-binding protein